VGIDSGMSHVAHSVGVPTVLKHHAELALAHPNKSYAAFRDERELAERLGPLLPRRRWHWLAPARRAWRI